MESNVRKILWKSSLLKGLKIIGNPSNMENDFISKFCYQIKNYN